TSLRNPYSQFPGTLIHMPRNTHHTPCASAVAPNRSYASVCTDATKCAAPMVEFVEKRSDVSTLVIVTPSPQNRVQLIDQIFGFQGHATPGKLAHSILKALD